MPKSSKWRPHLPIKFSGLGLWTERRESIVPARALSTGMWLLCLGDSAISRCLRKTSQHKGKCNGTLLGRYGGSRDSESPSALWPHRPGQSHVSRHPTDDRQGYETPRHIEPSSETTEQSPQGFIERQRPRSPTYAPDGILCTQVLNTRLPRVHSLPTRR